MTKLQTMYPGVANSPETFLKEALTIDGTIMYLADGSVLGEIPTLAVIGEGQQAETVLVVSTRSDGGFAINRGVEGPKKAWTKATTVARNWTNKDYETIRANIEAVNANASNRADENEFHFDMLSQSIDQLNADFNNAVEDKVDKVDGKGLSTYDYDDEAKAKVDAIPPDPKYTDTVPDLTPYAKKEETNELIESVGAEVESIRQHLDQAKLDKTDIVNDLTTGGADKALSAEQGKTLEDTKLDKTDVINDLTTGGADKALSAEQGKVLFTYADDGKKSIADAIVGKGVDATKSDDFNTLADKISKIKTGYGVGDVLPEGNVEVRKTSTPPKKIWEFIGHTGEVNALAIASDGSIYSCCDDKKVFKISPNGQKIWEFTQHTKRVWSVKVALDGSVYSSGEDNKIFKISPGGQKIWEYQWPGRFLGKLAVGPDGSVYACGFDCKVAKISPDGKQVWRFNNQAGDITSIAVGQDGSVYSGDSKHKVFKISPDGQKVWEFVGHTDTVHCLAVDSNDSIYSGAGDGDSRVFKISSDGQKIWEFSEHTSDVYALAVGPDGSIYSSGGDSRIFKLSPSGRKIWEFKGDASRTRALAVGQDGSIYSGDGKYFSDSHGNKITKIVDYTTSYKIIK